MEAPWIVVLVLLGALALTLGIFGTWVYVRGRRILELREENCKLVQDAARAIRAVRQAKYVARIEGMTGNEMAREFDRLFADLVTGPGPANRGAGGDVPAPSD